MSDETNAITLRELEFSWQAGTPPILAIDRLEVKRGERLFIKGPSGSGKSTLLSLLGGVTTPQKGTVEVLGQPLQKLSGAKRDHFRAAHIGFVFQMFNLLPYLSTVDNVTLPCRFSAVRRERVSRQGVGLETEALRLLGHLDLADAKLLARPVTELSVGQQQRVAVARALMGAPEIVIADEPTSALDWDRREAFLKLLENECAAQGITLLFVSHDPSLEPLFDRTVPLAELNHAAQGGA